METNVVNVKLYGFSVGYLYWDKKTNAAIFEYEPEFLSKGLDFAPLTMSIYTERSMKHLPWTGNKEKIYSGLPPVFADSLPDKWGNSLFKAWLRDNNISTKKVTPIDHLSFIGNRAIGALEYEPALKLDGDNLFDVDVTRLYEFAKKVLSNRENTIVDIENSYLWQDLIKISSSAGGKRPKAIVAINKETGEIISGQGVIPSGFEHYILKYDDDSNYPYAKLEYIFYQMAIASGIIMMPSELKVFGNVNHFLTHRFDRIGNNKIHTQTLAAMSPGSDSYEDLFTAIRKLNLPYDDIRQQYLRMVFNVISRNIDDHAKNFSFCMNHEGIWSLSPAYDLTFSVDLSAPSYVNRHSLSLNGKTEDILYADLEKIAQANDIQDCKSLIQDVKDSLSDFNRLASSMDINKKLIQSIKNEFNFPR